MIIDAHIEDFIGVFDTDVDCKVFIDYFKYMESTSHFKRRREDVRADDLTGLNFFLTLRDTSTVEFAGIYNESVAAALALYEEEYKFLADYKFQQHYINIQKTVPGQGYHGWHCENHGNCNTRRVLATMIYLNDDFEGGETEFLYQSRRLKPKASRVVIWPAGFTHTHRGNPPLTGEKYIATSWLENTNV